jgi:rhodanese-related sulfurtransferase
MTPDAEAIDMSCSGEHPPKSAKTFFCCMDYPYPLMLGILHYMRTPRKRISYITTILVHGPPEGQGRGMPDKIIIDLRTPSEYREGHMKGSINIPHADIRLIKSKVKDKNTEILLYCKTGKHSNTILYVLRYMGYKNVTDMGALTI